jgi:hypothetical protein
MPQGILDDIESFQKDIPSSLEEEQKKLKWFCLFVALSCFSLSGVLVIWLSNNPNFDFKILGVDAYGFLAGFPYALMCPISAVIYNLELYPNPWIKKVKEEDRFIINNQLVLKVIWTFLGWSLISPLAGFMGFLVGVLPILAVLFTIVDTVNHSSLIVWIIVFITYLIGHLIWAIGGYYQLKGELDTYYKKYLLRLKSTSKIEEQG